MLFLVAGGTGLVGNNVIRALLTDGHQVRALVRSTSDPRSLEGLEVEWALGDVRDADSVRKAANGVDVVIHAAADLHIGWTGMERCRAVNVEGTKNMVQAAKSQNAKFVHVSSVDALSAAENHRPVNEETPVSQKVPCTYVVTKRQAEDVVLSEINKGLDAVIVNPGFMLGPWDWKPSSGRMLLTVATSFTPIAPPGGMSACDVRDVASAIVRISLRNDLAHRRYILAGENITYFDAWRLFARITGGRPPFKAMRPVMAKLIGLVGDAWTMVSRSETDINSAMLQMSRQFNYYDSTRAREEVGYQSRPFEITVRDAWDWLQMHHVHRMKGAT